MNSEDWSVDAFIVTRESPRTFATFGARDLTLLQAGSITRKKGMDEPDLWVAGGRLSVRLAARDPRDGAMVGMNLTLPSSDSAE